MKICHLEKLNKLFKILKIRPKNIELYVEALTHTSYANENKLSYNYQRLEFLGDAILQKYVSLFLFKEYENLPEGELTILRSKYVREESIVQITNILGINDYIYLGNGEIQSDGKNKPRILADIYESLIAAIYLDLGPIVVEKFINNTLIAKINDHTISLVEDYKTLMQEYLQSTKQTTLKYETFKEENNIYYVNAKLDNLVFATGKGSSRVKAEQDAAKNAYKKLVKK